MHSKYKHFSPPSEAIEARITTILDKLSLEEKIDLLGGKDDGHAAGANENAGIPLLRMSDGPMGIHWWCDSSTAYPAVVGAAASWNRDLVYRLGESLGNDARARGVHILLAPGVNIYRSPLCGRNFEYMGEDPYLASEIVVQYVKGCQDQGVASTVKHYAVNFQEYDRHYVSSDLDERTLREIYLPAFKAAIQEGGSGALMTSYNLVNGTWASENRHLLVDILRNDWGFDGVAMSDWGATYHGIEAANGGLDLEMPDAAHMNRDNLLPALGDGRVCEDVIDDKIRRLLRLAICFGWFDREQQDKSIPMEDARSRKVALDVARGSIVLLKNEEKMLPLDTSRIRKLAVVGSNAHPAVIGGGGSAHTTPNHVVSILDAIRDLVADEIEVVHATGPNPTREWGLFGKSRFSTKNGEKGLVGEYFNNGDLGGEPAVVRTDDHVNFHWCHAAPADEIDAEKFSVRWTGSIRPDRDGPHLFYTKSTDSSHRLIIDGEEELNTASHLTQTATLEMKAGRSYDLTLEYKKTRYWAEMFLGWEHADNIIKEREAAIEVVRNADAAVFCMGFEQYSESEGFDRSFALHPESDLFITQAAETNANIVVVLLAGGNVDMQSWVNKVKGALHVWYPGQEGGTAVAEALFGRINPSGKLPMTFERRLEDRSSFDCYHDDDGDKRVELTDGIFCGYRHMDKQQIAPAFPFGFGLSYTSFSIDNLKLSADTMKGDETITVSVDVTNTGDRPGAEVVQMYISDLESSLPRPLKELKGFDRVELQPGETKTAKMSIDRRSLQYYNPERGSWIAEPGEFEALIGTSCTDINLRRRFMLEG